MSGEHPARYVPGVHSAQILPSCWVFISEPADSPVVLDLFDSLQGGADIQCIRDAKVTGAGLITRSASSWTIEVFGAVRAVIDGVHGPEDLQDGQVTEPDVVTVRLATGVTLVRP